MDTIYRYSFQVDKNSIDVLGHVNNREYLRWMEEAATQHASGLGWDAKTLIRQGKVWVARQHWIEYLRPTFEGDELTMYTWVENWNGARSLRRYAIKKGNILVCIGATQWVYIDYKTGRPTEVPESVSSTFGIVPLDDERLAQWGIGRAIRYEP